MTRFARAKGSKSSNLKAPEDSTPWEVMKEQMLQAKRENEDIKNRQAAENQRIENYSNFLKEQKVQKRKATWCDFPEAESSKKAKLQTLPDQDKTTKKKKKNKNVDDNHNKATEDESNLETVSRPPSDSLNKKKKNKNKLKNINNNHNPSVKELSIKDNESSNITSNASNKKKNKNKKKKKSETEQNEQVNGVNREHTVHKKDIEQEEEQSKKKKRNINFTHADHCNKAIENQKNKQINHVQKKKKIKKQGEKPARRKEINDRSFQLIINGKEVELVRFDGFPIMKKDAERIKELRTNMIQKGIPKSEVNRNIKLERRRAEKALARLKRDVCYNCRKGGHNLSDCPDLKSSIPGVDAAEGVCFKCGSTEHRQFECKVQRNSEFRFASCFICKEQGHIARQCPDNPKGLYPNGGSCKLCGDVTHLRKDCPTVQTKSEGTSIKLQTLDTGSNIEDIGVQSNPVSEDAPKKPKKIKF